MKFFLALITFATFVTMPVNAGLGDAVTKKKTSSYDAWCGERGNDCRVSFEGGKITVNEIDSVDFEDITYITKNRSTYGFPIRALFTFGVEYLEEGMDDPAFAEILFTDFAAANSFWRDLQRACRECKDRNAPTVDVNITE